MTRLLSFSCGLALVLTLMASAPLLAETKPGVVDIGGDEDLPAQFRETARKNRQDMLTQGFLASSEQRVTNIRNFRRFKIPLPGLQRGFKPALLAVDEARGRLTFKLAALGDAFESFELQGGITGGSGGDTGPWEELTRYFTARKKPGAAAPKAPDQDVEPETIVSLKEFDYVSAKGSATFNRETLNEDVKGAPAVYVVLKDPKGNLLADVKWWSPKKIFELEMTGTYKTNESLADIKAAIMRLARSIE